MTKQHIPRRSGTGIRLAIPRPWTGPHPLSMRAATARRQEALAEAKVAELRTKIEEHADA